MAKIDFSTPIMNLNDVIITDSEGKDLDLGIVCINALLANFPKEELTGVEKLHRFNLAQDINLPEKQIDLKPEDIDLFKKLVEQVYGTLIYGRVMEILPSD